PIMTRRSLQLAPSFSLALTLALAAAFSAGCHSTHADPRKSALIEKNSAAKKSQPDDTEARNVRFVKNPDPPPALDVKHHDGKPISLDDTKGKIVLLNFWATWCGPCRAEIPDLIELQTKYKDQLAIIALATDEDEPDDVKKFAQKTHINYRVGMASDPLRMK